MDMDKDLYKSRNASKCVKAGYLFLSSNYKRIFKSIWLPALLVAIAVAANVSMTVKSFQDPASAASLGFIGAALQGAFSVLLMVGSVWLLAALYNLFNAEGLRPNIIKGVKLMILELLITIIVTIIVGLVVVGFVYLSKHTEVSSPDDYKSFIIKAGCTAIGLIVLLFVLSLPFVYFIPKYMMEKIKMRKSFFKAYKTGFRNWGFLFLVVFIIGLISLVIMALTTLPLIILSGAQGASLQGTIAFGDPSGMPSYFVWLFFLTTLITSFIMSFVSAWMLFTATYAYGSIEHNKQERRVAKHKNVV